MIFDGSFLISQVYNIYFIIFNNLFYAKYENMKKITTTLALLFAAAAMATAQTAPNWTAVDCNSVSHTLHTELDNGKIIVFVWVMPCASCINGAKAAYDAVQNSESRAPGKILYYLSDDVGDHSCGDLTTWINANSIGNTAKMTLFGNAGNTINEAGFGGSGMPHVIVMAGSDHKIYFNKLNNATNDRAGIETAINSAISALNVEQAKKSGAFTVSPNPVSGILEIKNPKAISSVSVISASGQVIKQESYTGGKANPTINMAGIAAGVYSIRITDVNGQTAVQKIVKE